MTLFPNRILLHSRDQNGPKWSVLVQFGLNCCTLSWTSLCTYLGSWCSTATCEGCRGQFGPPRPCRAPGGGAATLASVALHFDTKVRTPKSEIGIGREIQRNSGFLWSFHRSPSHFGCKSLAIHRTEKPKSRKQEKNRRNIGNPRMGLFFACFSPIFWIFSIL